MNKIFIIRDELLNYGGAEKLFIQQIIFYKKKNYQVFLFCEKLDKSFEKYLPDTKIVFLSKINLVSKFFKFLVYLLILRPKKVFFHESGYHFIWPLIKIFRFKYFIFLHDSIFWYENSQLAFTRVYKKYFKIFSTSSFYEKFIKEKNYSNFLLKFCMKIYYEFKAVLDFFGIKYSDKVITICEDSKKEIDKIYKINSIIFYPGTNFNSKVTTPKKNIQTFFTVNRLTPRKRIELLIKAYYFFEKKNKNSLLVIAGIGPSLEDYKRLVIRLGLIKKIIFPGFLTELKLMDYYQKCDVVLYPQWGSWGLVPLEALYYNKKVIVASDSGTKDLKKFFKNSVLIAKPDVKNFYKKMILSSKNVMINTHMVIKKKFTIKEYFKRIDKI
jgi:glycosyltransferase involved in cell wall biosynthesis